MYENEIDLVYDYTFNMYLFINYTLTKQCKALTLGFFGVTFMNLTTSFLLLINKRYISLLYNHIKSLKH